MPDAAKHIPPSFAGLASLIAVWALSSPAFAGDAIYKYVDDKGTIHFTEQWHLIPEKYHSRVQTIDPATGQPFKPKPLHQEPVPSRSAPLQTAPSVQPPPEPAPFYAAWLEQFAKLSIPLPSRYQLGVGLTTLVLIFGAFKIMRLTTNPLLKIMLKASIMVMLAGSVYAMYISGLNEQISEATRDPAHPTATGKDLIQGTSGAVNQLKGAINKATAPLKDATIGEVSRTVDKANEANRQTEKTLHLIESNP
jgi:hypothetical protein